MNVYAGLCGGCRHAQVVLSRRGSRFTLCTLSRHDPRFPKYPRLPVVSCIGFAPVLDTDTPGADPVIDADANADASTGTSTAAPADAETPDGGDE